LLDHGWVACTGMAANQGAGTLGLVNDLSVKLAKQRKQLNGLVKDVKASTAKETRWYHYVGATVLNNIVIVVLGIMVGNLLYGIGSEGGSLIASMLPTLRLSGCHLP